MLHPRQIINKPWVYVLDAVIFTILILFIYFSFHRVNQLKGALNTPLPAQTTGNKLPPELKSIVRGIDVSHYQGTVDWQQVAGSYHFAFIKATEGNHYQDPAFSRNLDSVISTSMEVGAYHFFTPDKDATEQAKHFLTTIADFELSLPPVLDVEVAPDGSTEAFQKAIEQWIGVVEAGTGCTPIIYTGKAFWNQYLQDRFSDHPIWISDYTEDDNKVAAIPWSFWQFTDSGSAEGVSGPVDESRYHGSESTLRQLGSCEV